MFQATFAPVAVDHFSSGYPLDIVAGNDVLYVWHADGTALHDADGAGSTNGDYSTRGTNFEGGASIADLDGDNVKELIGIVSDSTQVFVFDQAGNAKPELAAGLGRRVVVRRDRGSRQRRAEGDRVRHQRNELLRLPRQRHRADRR
jgi:hypothetical protein